MRLFNIGQQIHENEFSQIKGKTVLKWMEWFSIEESHACKKMDSVTTLTEYV